MLFTVLSASPLARLVAYVAAALVVGCASGMWFMGRWDAANQADAIVAAAKQTQALRLRFVKISAEAVDADRRDAERMNAIARTLNEKAKAVASPGCVDLGRPWGELFNAASDLPGVSGGSPGTR
ncbi:hypothetical protein HZB60_04060 [candidate division KSB1 bacterium]|nr:hypothetical protein [candidate division KSB1 bacterium]